MESNGADGFFQDLTQVHSVLQALNKQRSSSKLCDVILKISDEQICAHSNILASASPYFDLLLSEQDLPRAFSQKSPLIIEIHIEGPNDPGYITAVHKVVDFMYSSRIEFEDGILMHVLEIARIMQMANIIDFCDMFLQGCSSFIKSGNLKQDVDTQTDENGCNGIKTLKNKVGEVSARKRGRPRKVISDNHSSSDSCNERNLDEKENVQDTSSYSFKEETSDIKCEPVEGQEEGSKRSAPLVSKRGRIIKPKKFSDEMVSFVKEEPLSDDEVDDLENTDGTNNIHESNNDSVISETQPVKTVELYECELCEQTFSNEKEFSAHNQEHQIAERKCNYCGWVFNGEDVTDEVFQDHVNSHEDSNPFGCTFCSKSFNSRNRLHLHMPKHFKIKPFTCEICEASFKWKHALKTHMNVHKTSKDYLCDICGFATAHKAQLKAHKTIHTGDTFKCEFADCDYQAIKKSNLKFHMLTHTGEKPHQCELCGQSFSLLKNMRRHMLLHATDRPLKCEKCNFGTTRYDKLKEHYFKLHNIGEKPKKKLRLTEYMKLQNRDQVEQIEVVNECQTSVLNIGEGMETIELEVAEEANGTATTQIVNVTSSTGEAIPIAITQNGTEISYQITQDYPIQIISGEVIAE